MLIVAIALKALSPVTHDISFPAYGLGFMSLICDEQPIRWTIEVTFISASYSYNETLIRPRSPCVSGHARALNMYIYGE
jgi:hypothetical protein